MGITLKQLTSAITKVKDYANSKFAVVSPHEDNAIHNREDGIFVEDKQPQINELKAKIDPITKYQKYVNTELDYGVFKVVNTSAPVKFDSVISGNMELSNDKYIKLKKEKTYVFHIGSIGYCLVDAELNVLSESQKTDSYIYYASEDIEVTFIASNDAISELSCVNVHEINRQITIDPLEHVNESDGIEDTSVGHLITHMGSVAPKHYLICDGSEYSIKDYPRLAQHIEDVFGSVNYFGGDGINTFCVPESEKQYDGITGAPVLYCIKCEPTYFMVTQNKNYLQPSIYSREEQIIGGWIDGKPLYRKTIVTKVPKTSTQIALNLKDLSIENITSFVSSFLNETIIATAPNTSGDNYLSFWYNKTAKLLHVACTEESWYGCDLYITIQYTKTSDEADSFNNGMLDYVESPGLSYSNEDVTNAINALW